jgi:hypothetical protein
MRPRVGEMVVRPACRGGWVTRSDAIKRQNAGLSEGILFRCRTGPDLATVCRKHVAMPATSMDSHTKDLPGGNCDENYAEMSNCRTGRWRDGNEFRETDRGPAGAVQGRAREDASPRRARPARQAHGQRVIEAVNSKLRAECLNAHWFMSLADACKRLEDCCRHYNEDRPHSAIGYNVPIAMHYPGGVTSPSS